MTRVKTPAGALVYADLDRFKAFNDRLGHPAGDAALVRFSRLLLQTVRGDDVAACPETAATRESLPQQADAALFRA